MLRLLLPASADFLALGAVWVSGFVLLLWGRLLTFGRGLPEIQIVAGWGGLAIVLTLWGALLPWPMWWPMAGIGGLALSTLLVPRLTLGREEWLALGRLTALALPLWAMLLTAQPSQPDTFINLLPNAAYLYDHAMFPADTRPPAHSYLPGAPYNLQLWAYLAGAALPEFPGAAMAHINVLLYLLAGLLLARVVRRLMGDPTDPAEPSAPGWGAIALGLLLAIPLNPGFVPRIHFSDYTDAAIAVLLAMAAWLAALALRALAEGRRAGAMLWPLALVLAALVNVKQESVAMVAALAPGIAALSLCDRGVRFWRGMLAFLPAFLPAAALYLLWRWFVLTHFAAGELKLRPPEQWHWDLLPQIFAGIGGEVREKGLFYGVLFLSFLPLGAAFGRRGLDLTARLSALLLGAFIAYNAFLVFVYVAHFEADQSIAVHSYFRYSQHLSLLMMLVLAACASERFELRLRGRRAVLGAVVVAIVWLALPVGFAQRLRFDLAEPQPLLRALVRDAAGFIGPGEKLAAVLPGEGGAVSPMLEGLLRFAAPRRPGVDLTVLDRLEGTTLASLAQKGIAKVLISCTAEDIGDVPAGRAVLLEREGEDWHAVAVWRYPEPTGERWKGLPTTKPFCR